MMVVMFWPDRTYVFKKLYQWLKTGGMIAHNLPTDRKTCSRFGCFHQTIDWRAETGRLYPNPAKDQTLQTCTRRLCARG